MTLPGPDQLPRVSILIINLNYGRYISQSIRSVLAQDYPNIECIIVDNGSTDDSVAIVQSEIAGHPQCRLIRLDANLGQLGAFFQVLEHCNGEFVTLLDADDILSPAFASSHVQVHLALPRPVALTSSNVREIDAEGRIWTGRFQHFGSDALGDTSGLIDRSRAVRVPGVSDAEFDRLSARTCSVPFEAPGWFWSPGSAGMYRRAFLTLIRQARTPPKYVRPADAYLNPFCHALGASALIDVSLSHYRIHGANYFAMHETISGMKTGRPEFAALHEDLALETADFFLENSARFHRLLGVERYWEALDQLMMSMTPAKVHRSRAFVECIARHIPTLQATFGDERLARALMSRLRKPRLFELARRCATSSNLGFIVNSAARLMVEPPRRERRRASATRVGVRPSDPERAVPQTGPPEPPRPHGPVALLSDDPPIFMTGIASGIGIAGAFGRRFGDRPVGFLVYPTESIEGPGRVPDIGRSTREHRRLYPRHRFIFMANTQTEEALLATEGLPTIFLNKSFTVSEKIRPLPAQAPEFDAVYNARFIPEKRHELAALIDSVAYLGYVSDIDSERQQQIALMQQLLGKNPSHVLLNPLVDGRPKRLSHVETNAQLNRARIGLCLSEVEGSNYASMEYMLAGLGVVSTPSRGARDVYFDPEFCIICEPNPEAVRDAVAELKARKIPRKHIRQATLKRVEAERRRLIDLIDDLRVNLGGWPRGTKDWTFGETSGLVRWDTFDAHLEEFERTGETTERWARSQALAEITAFAEPGIQLQPSEMIPVVRAILAVSGCRLLVFGCGKDSPFWEKVNAGGTTAFIEDDPTYSSDARSRLTGSIIEDVQYHTRVVDWPAQLDAGDALRLDLSEAIKARRWDVILVDGPSGGQDNLPGRAQSIVTARWLVAPGGKIFVHDCDRPLEQQFCARYLDERRRFVSVRGRAILNGYAF